ncbi:lipid A core-O-antigen ligase-like enyme [Pleurocapsa sp. PCC 7327]|uniref:O-antigen ligase family protein n=1 Tax=Pleurocapsa sp. PCC 7327 TaxID=118163 RepID=UPI00029FB3E0|nr:O-antigen ligase [Pleurocapsa sp. PCC 7327]AFY76039.1 lipid A core-O-antigen ligase-like enyme [Pleurocapsa sp. PCC 7327]
MKSPIEVAETCFVIVSLLLFTGGILKVLQLADVDQNALSPDVSSPIEQVIFLAIQGISLLLVLGRWKLVVSQLLKTDKLILFLLVSLLSLILLSALWSRFPIVTLRRCLALWGTTIFGIYFATRYSFKEQLKILLYTFGLAIFLSFLFAIALPRFGMMSGLHEGAWRGIYLHKNGLGSMMTLSSMLFLVSLKSGKSGRITKWLGLIFSFLLVLLSSSKSALVTFVCLFVILHMCSALRWYYDLVIPGLIGGVGVVTSIGIWLIDNFDNLLRAMGKDPTLTGRTDMWPLIWESILARPWLGYGYSGFWQGFDSDAAYVWYALGWEPTHPHNGLLELLLIFGVIGMSIYILLFLASFVRSLFWIRITRDARYFWLLIFLSYTILTNLAETRVLEYNSITWVLYIATILAQPDSFDIVFKKHSG